MRHQPTPTFQTHKPFSTFRGQSHALGDKKLPTWCALETTDAVLLSWSFPERTTGTKQHKSKLEELASKGGRAWIRLNSSLLETRFRLTPAEHTFARSTSSETIVRELKKWYSPQDRCSDRVYLVAQEHVKDTCYDITDYVRRCITGDSSVAERLRGRTVFVLEQIETGAFDLLSEHGASEFAECVLQSYVQEYDDFIGNTMLGFCCRLPSFLSPLRIPASTIPWSPELKSYFQSIWGGRFTEFLPLVFYGAYNTAAVRSAFWNGLTEHYSKVLVNGFRHVCHRFGLQFAIEISASGQSLEFDIATVLKYSDGAIFTGAGEKPSSNESQHSKEKPRKADYERLRLRTSSPLPYNTPKRFLIAKWITSRASTASSGNIRICRSEPPTTTQYAFDRVLGFDYWLAHESKTTGKSEFKRHEKLVSQGCHSQSTPLNRARNAATGFACSMGEPQRSVLIVSPLQSLWSRTDGCGWREITDSWAWLCQTVWNLGYDFDIATESDCVDAKFDKDSRSVRINSGVYRVVLISSCISLQESTVSWLTDVVAGRGKLIVDEPVPYLFNSKMGLDTHPLELLLYHQRATLLRGTAIEKTENLKQLLRKWVKPVLRIYARPDNSLTDAILSQHRRTEKFDQFYLFNATQSSIETLIQIRGESVKVEEWGATGGERSEIDFWHADGNTYLNRSFGGWQTRLVSARRKARGPQS